MLPKKIEDVISPVVKKFVAELEKRYKKHCSDEMLEALLIFGFGQPYDQKSEKTRAEELLAGNLRAAYDASVWLFESVLEDSCQAGGNGHHVAQKFEEAMAVVIPKKTQ